MGLVIRYPGAVVLALATLQPTTPVPVPPDMGIMTAQLVSEVLLLESEYFEPRASLTELQVAIFAGLVELRKGLRLNEALGVEFVEFAVPFVDFILAD